MYRVNQKQLKFEDFYLPFGDRLRSDNRWVKLAKLIPWHEFEDLYGSSFAGSSMGAPVLSVRVALGALSVKKRLGTSDEETVEQIKENLYLQYFWGFEEYSEEAPFHPTMFVHFRKHLGKKALRAINEPISAKALDSGSKAKQKCQHLPTLCPPYQGEQDRCCHRIWRQDFDVSNKTSMEV